MNHWAVAGRLAITLSTLIVILSDALQTAERSLCM